MTLATITATDDSIESLEVGTVVALTHSGKGALAELGAQRVAVRTIAQFRKVLVAVLFAVVGHICEAIPAVERAEDVFHRLKASRNVFAYQDRHRLYTSYTSLTKQFINTSSAKTKVEAFSEYPTVNEHRRPPTLRR